MSYNIIRKDISNGLSGKQISSIGAGNYLILRYAPALANVRVRLGANTAPEISLNQNDTIEYSSGGDVYIEANPVPNSYIEFAQAKNSKDFKIIPSPSIDLTVDSFFNPKIAVSYTLASGASQIIDVSSLSGVRFLASDYVDVFLDGGSVGYKMLEDEIFTKYINSITFKNNGTASITLTVWEG